MYSTTYPKENRTFRLLVFSSFVEVIIFGEPDINTQKTKITDSLDNYVELQYYNL